MEEQRKRRILYAEDDEMARGGCVRNMRRKGYEVLAAGDGQKALEIYRNERAAGRAIDFVITDISMPKMPGWKLIETLREEGFDGPIAISTGTLMTDEFKEKHGVIGDSLDITELLETYEQWKAQHN